jgi:hypothetical protein
MINKFPYPIFPNRTYTLRYDTFEAEVSGEEILAMFHRSLYLDKLLDDLSTETDLSDDLNTPDF